MSADPIDTGTWRWERMLATWSLHSDRPAQDLLVLALESLGGFATVSKAEWATASEGECALVQTFATAPSPLMLAASFDGLPDFTGVDFELSLRCLRTDGSVAEIPDGAILFFEQDGALVRVAFAINVDLFAAHTWGRHRDNVELARLNGPRLNAFLARLRMATEAEAHELDVSASDADFTAEGVSLPP